VHIELLASLQDQLERCAANSIMLGTSAYTAQWGRLIDFAAVAKNIPSCPRCKTKLLSGHNQKSCVSCANWNTDGTNGVSDFLPPRNYPQCKVPLTGKFPPLKLTYSTLKQAVYDAHNFYVNGNWTTNNVQSYLRVHGINNDVITEILECAENCKLFHEADDCNADEIIYLNKQREENPEMFEMWKFPSLWDHGVELFQHIDVVMHLLFLGIVKTCIQKVIQWTKL
jgi:hypothetical protein